MLDSSDNRQDLWVLQATPFRLKNGTHFAEWSNTTNVNFLNTVSVQFVCVESLVTAVVDMYPKTFRVGYRRELLILGMSVVSFLIGLIMLTEVIFDGVWLMHACPTCASEAPYVVYYGSREAQPQNIDIVNL